jgi:hypothetical protein
MLSDFQDSIDMQPSRRPMAIPHLSSLVPQIQSRHNVSKLGFHGSSRPPSPSSTRALFSPLLKTKDTGSHGRDNWNENGGRPFYECWNVECLPERTDKFARFSNMRGIHLKKPSYGCGIIYLDWVQVAGERGFQQTPQAIYCRCAVGGCGFFGHLANDDGRAVNFRRQAIT